MRMRDSCSHHMTHTNRRSSPWASRFAYDIDIKCGPCNIARTKLSMVNRHVLGAHCLRVDTVEERNRSTSQDTRRDVACFGRFLRWLGYNRNRGRIKRSPYPTWRRLCTVRSEGWRGWFRNIQRKLKALSLRRAGDVQKFETRGHIVIQ